VNSLCVIYHSEKSLDNEEDEVERDHHENREFTLHQTPNEPEYKEEGLPDEAEKPEYKGEVHHYLNTIRCGIIDSLTYPSIAKVI
jgi:hypothetical protein